MLTERSNVISAVLVSLASEFSREFWLRLGNTHRQNIETNFAHDLQYAWPCYSGHRTDSPQFRPHRPTSTRRRYPRGCRGHQHSHLLRPSRQSHGSQYQLCWTSDGLHKCCRQCLQYTCSLDSRCFRHWSGKSLYIRTIQIFLIKLIVTFFFQFNSFSNFSCRINIFLSTINNKNNRHFFLTDKCVSMEQNILSDFWCLCYWSSGFPTLWFCKYSVMEWSINN